MLVQIWLSVLLAPELNKEQESELRQLVQNKLINVWNPTEDRRLSRVLIEKSNIETLIGKLEEIWYNPIICWVQWQNWNNITWYEKNQEEYDKYFVEVEYTDTIEWEEISWAYTPSWNTTIWYAWFWEIIVEKEKIDFQGKKFSELFNNQ